MSTTYLSKLERRLKKLKKRLETLESNHKGREQKLTYWAGFNLGFLKGRISEIEDILDNVDDNSRGEQD